MATNNAHRNCYNFVAVVEELLERRLSEEKIQRLEDFYVEFSFYRDLRRGRIKNLPLRHEVMRIADHLLCTLAERNRLLNAANYVPVIAYVEGEMLEHALRVGKRIIDDLPLAAFVITRDDTMHHWNDVGLRLFNTIEKVELQRPIEERSILRYIFAPDTPVYDVFTNYRRSFRWHRYTCRLNVLRFKQDNVFCQHDQWYRERVESLMDLPEFRHTWDEIQIDTGMEKIMSDMPPGMIVPEYLTHIYTPAGDEFRLRGMQIDYMGWGYPRIFAYTYDGEESRRIFTKLGIPTPDNGFGYL